METDIEYGSKRIADLAPPAAMPKNGFGPVKENERIHAVDVLRGFALLGILVMNIYAFAMPFAGYQSPLPCGGDSKLDLGTWYVTHILFDQKMMSIFSMLFGAGLVLMARRADAKDQKFGRFYYRRLLWLLMFGLVHAYLLWVGDILFFYGICGMLLFPFRKLSARTLIITGICLMLVAPPVSTAMGFMFGWMRGEVREAHRRIEAEEELEPYHRDLMANWDEMRKGMDPPPKEIRRQIKAHQGSYNEIFMERLPALIWMQTILLVFSLGWRITGLMMLGMGLMKAGVFSAGRTRGFYLKLVALGYCVGFLLVGISAFDLTRTGWDFVHMFKIGMYWNYFGSVFVALGHVGMVMLVFQSGTLGWLREALSAVGRMAFTNYLMHTLICTTIFYGYAFGQFGRIDRFALMGIVLAIWILQLALSPLWLRHFKFGPAEWLWRSLTYRKLQPMRR